MVPELRPSESVPRVLLVDDDHDTLDLYSLFLSSRGFEVDQVSSGRGALESVHHRPPQVIVTDLNLPDVEGAKLCSTLRAAGGTALAGLIVLSGSADDRVLSDARAAGATVLLAKPCLPDALEATIRRVLGQGSPSAPR